MQLLREVVPAANRIAVFVNPTDAENYQSTLREVEFITLLSSAVAWPLCRLSMRFLLEL